MSCEYLATGSPKCTCDACLMTAPVHVALQLRDALTHERDRARRVVRVFWRIDGLDGCWYIRRDAIAVAKEAHGGHWLMCLRRVTVRRKRKP